MFNTQKRYFKQKLDGVQKMIWDLEFKRFKTQEIREEIRVQYDALRSKLEILQTQLKSEKENPTMKEGDRKRLEDDEVRFKRDIERYKAQMDQLDMEVHGAKPSSDYPDGLQGLNHQLDALRELQGMMNSYIQKQL